MILTVYNVHVLVFLRSKFSQPCWGMMSKANIFSCNLKKNPKQTNKNPAWQGLSIEAGETAIWHSWCPGDWQLVGGINKNRYFSHVKSMELFYVGYLGYSNFLEFDYTVNHAFDSKSVCNWNLSILRYLYIFFMPGCEVILLNKPLDLMPWVNVWSGGVWETCV